MGHHFDSRESRVDSRINITDNYIFHADTSGAVVAVMAVSPLAGLPSPFTGALQWQTFRPGCGYDFRFDNDGDARADRVLLLVFDGAAAPQRWQAFWLEGDEARDHHANGRWLGDGLSGQTSSIPGLGRIWVGEAGDPFWLDAVAAKAFIDGLVAGSPWQPDAFSAGSVTTGATNVIAIVAEIALALLGERPLGLFTTVSANDHGHWTQVQRCGRPNLAATFLDDPQHSLRYNGTTPDTDLAEFGPLVVQTTADLVRRAGTTSDPEGHGRMVAKALLPDLIPFDPTLPASFGFAGINGRGLRDDFGAVVYSTIFNHPMRTALAPLADLRAEWPYLSPPRPLPTLVQVAPRNQQRVPG